MGNLGRRNRVCPREDMCGPENADNEVGSTEHVIKKWLRIGVGVFLVLLGIVGLVLPIMPGWVFLIPGLVILAEYFPIVRRVLDWAKHKAGMSAETSGKP
jgi:Putative transmembrane protein (PGPGW)